MYVFIYVYIFQCFIIIIISICYVIKRISFGIPYKEDVGGRYER